MYPLQASIPGDLANGSTANVAIIAAVVVFGIIV
jgi:hypothetical protein